MAKNQIKMGAILSYVVILVNMIVGLVYTPFLVRMLGKNEYGLFSLVSSVISYLTVLDMGFGNAIIIYTARYREKNLKQEQYKLFGMFLIIFSIIGVVASFIGIFLYFNTDLIFGNSMTAYEIQEAKIMMIILTFNLAVTFPLSIFGNILTAYEEFVFNKIIKILNIVLQPILMIPLLFMGYKSITMVLTLTFINILCLVINAVVCIRRLKIKFVFGNFNFPLLKEIFSYSFYIFLAEIINKVNWSLDQFVLGAFCGTAVVAVYSVASQINTMYLAFSNAIGGVMLPKITKMEERGASDQEFTNEFIKTGRIQFLVMMMILTAFVLFGRYFIMLWAGPEYEQAYLITCILITPVTIPLIQNIGLSILQAKNKYRYRTMILFFVAIANVLVSIPLAINFGGVGSALGTAMAMIVGHGILLNIYYHKKVKINIIEFWKNIIKMMLPMLPLFIVSLVIVIIFPINSLVKFIVGVIIYLTLYVICVWKFSMNEYEKNLINKFAKKLHLKKS